MASSDAATASPLLSLPAELRELIFRHVVGQVTSKTPVVIWDHIYSTVFSWPPTSSTALLLTCRTIYSECLPLLYDYTTIELAVCSNHQTRMPNDAIDMGDISNCELLKRFRNIELEISFNAYNEAVMLRVIDRVSRLAQALNDKAQIKTLRLAFHEADDQWSNRCLLNADLVHQLLNEAASIQAEKIVAAHCNSAARRAMKAEQWQAIRQRAENYRADEQEQFMEISFLYWNHRSELTTRRRGGSE